MSIPGYPLGYLYCLTGVYVSGKSVHIVPRIASSPERNSADAVAFHLLHLAHLSILPIISSPVSPPAKAYLLITCLCIPVCPSCQRCQLQVSLVPRHHTSKLFVHQLSLSADACRVRLVLPGERISLEDADDAAMLVLRQVGVRHCQPQRHLLCPAAVPQRSLLKQLHLRHTRVHRRARHRRLHADALQGSF